MTRRAAIIVLDGVGIGAAPDAAAYGDAGSHTLGNIVPLAGVQPANPASAAFGSMMPKSAGKDSTAGHWEIAGVHVSKPFPTYPNGFPQSVLDEFARRTGRGVLGNTAASGTAIIAEHGEAHQRTGAWIVYTSADSVFQIAAHEETVPLEELYRGCEIARGLLVTPHDVSRVIARPFVGSPGAYQRTANRRDFSILPPAETLLDALAAAGIPRTGVGKVDDLFARRGITATHGADNAAGLDLIQRWIRGPVNGLLFANLVDFDQLFGHRNDVPGFHEALRQFDAALPDLIAGLREDDLLFVTADHGNDPTTPSTDHARECVPILAFGKRVRPADLGCRDTFSDLGATVAEWLGIPFRGRGTSFLPVIA